MKLTKPCKISKAHSGNGYGRRYIGKKAGISQYVIVSREALEEKLGRPLKPGMKACHHCDNPLCYEPEHLFEGTQVDNMRDAAAKGRARNQYGGQISKVVKQAVRIRFTSGDVTQASLANEFGISQGSVCHIIQGTI